MSADQIPTPEDDIQQALEQAHHLDATEAHSGAPLPNTPVSDTLVRKNTWTTAKYALSQCGLMAERYPWQTTAALLAAVGCGAVCPYFGWSVLGGLFLYAVTAEE